MKAWRVYGIGDARLDEIPPPEVKPGWVVLKMRVLQPSVTKVQQSQGKAVGVAMDFESMTKEQGPLQLFGLCFALKPDSFNSSQLRVLYCYTGNI